MRATTTYVPFSIVLIAAACASGPSAGELNQKSSGQSSVSSGSGTSTGGSAASTTSSSGTTGGSGMTSSLTTGSGTTGAGGVATGGITGTTSITGSTGDASSTTTGATTASGGMGGSGSTTGALTTTGSGGVGGGTSCPDTDPYCPRSGSFKMLVYSRTEAFRHDGSIATGKTMLQEIAAEQGFEVTITEENDLITPEGLAQFEIVFFMNPTGDIFNSTEEATFEAWVRNNGAFAGTHSATDTEEGWSFYKELTGQYYNGHVAAGTPGAIQFETDALDHPALVGLPNPWQRNEEWYKFDNFQQWSALEGFHILGRKQADNQPIMWVREHDNYRSFYTAIGHDAVVFQDPEVKKHITGGIMWAVRREHLIQ